MNELRLKAEISELEKLRSFVNAALKSAGISEEDFFRIELSLHEICVNVILYAYPGAEGDIAVRTWFEDNKVFFEVRDKGVAFDPRQSAPPDIRESIRTGKRGGFGIYLVRVLMDGLDYRREEGENVLTVFKKLSGLSPLSI